MSDPASRHHDDGALARAIASRSEADPACHVAEAELCRRFLPRLRAYGRRHLQRPEDVADLVQRVLLVVVQKLRAGAVREPDRIGSFVLGTARQVARELARGGSRSALEASEAEDLLPAETIALEPLDCDVALRALAALPERERSVLVLTFLHDQGAAEIAEGLGLSTANVRVIRHRALAKLREMLADRPSAERGAP